MAVESVFMSQPAPCETIDEGEEVVFTPRRRNPFIITRTESPQMRRMSLCDE